MDKRQKFNLIEASMSEISMLMPPSKIVELQHDRHFMEIRAGFGLARFPVIRKKRNSHVKI